VRYRITCAAFGAAKHRYFDTLEAASVWASAYFARTGIVVGIEAT
jgi:hypothetical protein